MLTKTMRVGNKRTSIKLEPEFWQSLVSIAAERQVRLSTVVNEIAESTPDRGNLASTLRKYVLAQMIERINILLQIVDTT